MTKSVICLLGPTASGKSELALRIAETFPVEIVSVDSALVYREMDIGTAKPSAKEQAQVPHHLIDCINPIESYSAAQFCTDARNAIADIQARERIPLLVGGTMLYFKALQQGLAPLPAANKSIRKRIEHDAKEKGWAALHQRLAMVDPSTAERLKPTDKQRIQRALEVFELSGVPLSELIKRQPEVDSNCYQSIRLIPNDRAWLHARIASRFQCMLEAGFIEEVEVLLRRWPQAKGKPAFKMVGYRQALEYLEHRNRDQLIETALAATRQLAKRQMTWLRHWPEGDILAPETDAILEKVLKVCFIK